MLPGYYPYRISKYIELIFFSKSLSTHYSCLTWPNIFRFHAHSDVDVTPANPRRQIQTPRSGRKIQTQRKLTYAVGSFKYDSVLPTEGGIFVPVQRSDSNSGNNKREPRLLRSAGTPDRLSTLLHTQLYKAYYKLQRSCITK